MHLENVTVTQNPQGQKLLVTMAASTQYFGVQLEDGESAKAVANKLTRLADEIRFCLKHATSEEMSRARAREKARLKHVEHTESPAPTSKPFYDVLKRYRR